MKTRKRRCYLTEQLKYLFPNHGDCKSINQNLMNSPYFFAEPLS